MDRIEILTDTNGMFLGICGTETEFKDSFGNPLRIGDTVEIKYVENEEGYVLPENKDNLFFVTKMYGADRADGIDIKIKSNTVVKTAKDGYDTKATLFVNKNNIKSGQLVKKDRSNDEVYLNETYGATQIKKSCLVMKNNTVFFRYENETVEMKKFASESDAKTYITNNQSRILRIGALY